MNGRDHERTNLRRRPHPPPAAKANLPPDRTPHGPPAGAGKSSRANPPVEPVRRPHHPSAQAPERYATARQRPSRRHDRPMTIHCAYISGIQAHLYRLEAERTPDECGLRMTGLPTTVIDQTGPDRQRDAEASSTVGGATRELLRGNSGAIRPVPGTAETPGARQGPESCARCAGSAGPWRASRSSGTDGGCSVLRSPHFGDLGLGLHEPAREVVESEPVEHATKDRLFDG